MGEFFLLLSLIRVINLNCYFTLKAPQKDLRSSWHLLTTPSPFFLCGSVSIFMLITSHSSSLVLPLPTSFQFTTICVFKLPLPRFSLPKLNLISIRLLWHLDCIMEGRCLNAAPVSCKWHVETIELWFVSGAEEGRIWCAPCPWSTLSKWQDLPVAGSQAVCRSTSFHCFWPLSGAHVWPTPMSFSSLHSTQFGAGPKMWWPTHRCLQSTRQEILPVNYFKICIPHTAKSAGYVRSVEEFTRL